MRPFDVRLALKGIAFTGALAGIVLTAFAGSSEWGPPGTPAYESYEAANRRVLLPWTITLVALLALLFWHLIESAPRSSFAIDALAIGGTAAIVAGNFVEFWIISGSTYDQRERGVAWNTFLAGHFIVLVAGFAYFVRDSSPDQ